MSRLTPSSRNSLCAVTAGAQSTTVSIPAGATWGLIGIGFYDLNVTPANPGPVTLDGQTATFIASAIDSSSAMVALFRVPIVSSGAGKTLAYTLTNTCAFVDIAVEYGDGYPLFGASSAAFNGGNPGTASTASLANVVGDLILTAYCVNSSGGSPTMGSGQSKLDETNDGGGADFGIYGFTTETGTGTSDVQSCTGETPAVASVVVTMAALVSQLIMTGVGH